VSESRTVQETAGRSAFDARKLIGSLPNRPGIYGMLNAAGRRLRQPARLWH